jgi:hypothetical protein
MNCDNFIKWLQIINKYTHAHARTHARTHTLTLKVNESQQLYKMTSDLTLLRKPPRICRLQYSEIAWPRAFQLQFMCMYVCMYAYMHVCCVQYSEISWPREFWLQFMWIYVCRYVCTYVRIYVCCLQYMYVYAYVSMVCMYVVSPLVHSEMWIIRAFPFQSMHACMCICICLW